MKKLFIALAAVALTACVKAPEKTVKVYAWQGEGGNTTEQTLQADFSKWHAHGVDGMCYNAGHDTEKIQRAAKAAHANGMEYHAWIPAMLQHGLDSTLYAVNRKGESAYSVQAYVPYYKCLCPNQEGTAEFLLDLYGKVADIPEVDYIHLDYIRYVDVILARGLWEKYGLVMDEEYPTADYCYCDKCVADFKAATGIDIKSVEDPSKCAEWAQFRCDLITKLVNRIADEVHGKGKKVSAAVFPGPDSHAKWMVRQEWNKWNIDAFFPMNYNDFYMEPAAWVGKVTKEEVEATTDLQRELNNYLDSFRSIVCYAAQIYGFYHEVSRLTDNMDDFTRQLGRSPTNALAVALSARRNRIYRELLLGSVEIVNDIRAVCLAENKMTERERMEIVFSVRPKLQGMNGTLQRLTKAVKYTTMCDIWYEIDGGARPAADKHDIAEAARRRWRQIGKNVRP